MMTCLATGQGGVLRLSRRPYRQQQRRLLLREGPARSLSEETEVCQAETQDQSPQSQEEGRHQADIR